MPFIPVPNVVQVEFRMTWDGQAVENVDYFDFGAPPGSGEMTTFGNALLDWWDNNYAPFAALNVVLREIYLTDLTSETGPAVTVTPDGVMAGDRGDESLPNNVSIAISFRTDQRGRSFRGRNYIVGLTVDQVVNNSVASASTDAIIDAYEALGAVATADGRTHVVVSRYTNNAPRVTGVATPITAYVIVDSTVDSQRRRLPGRGT